MRTEFWHKYISEKKKQHQPRLLIELLEHNFQLRHTCSFIWLSLTLILNIHIEPHFYIQSFWLNMLQSKPRVCVWVCVCASVCVWKLYSPNGCVDFDETLHKWSDRYLLVTFFSVFENSNLMTSWRPFCTFSMGHSHGRNFCPILFKFEYKVQSCCLQFAIENQQNRSISFDAITDRVFEKNPKWPPKIKFSNSDK